jgi:hypothetical protein
VRLFEALEIPNSITGSEAQGGGAWLACVENTFPDDLAGFHQVIISDDGLRLLLIPPTIMPLFAISNIKYLTRRLGTSSDLTEIIFQEVIRWFEADIDWQFTVHFHPQSRVLYVATKA